MSDSPRGRAAAGSGPAAPVPRGLYPVLLLHLLLSSLTFIIAKFVLARMPVAPVALLRFLIASSALAAIWLARGGRPEEFELRDWSRLALLGLLAVPMNQGCFLWGLQHSSPAHAALFYSMTPIFVLGISVLRGEERLRPARVAGLVLALLGVLLILLGRGLKMDPRYVFGDFLLLLAVASWALYSVNGRALMKEHDPFTVTAISLILGTTMSLPAVPWAFHNFHPAAYSAGIWAGVLFLALGTSVLAYFLWIWCLSKSEASRVAVFTNFQPVVTTILAFVIFREQFTAEFFVGGAMVMAGVFAVQRF